MVRQHAFTFLAPLLPDRVGSLRAILKKIEDDVETNPIFPFAQMPTIHFGRLLILERTQSERKREHIYPHYLVFSTNYDGSLDHHLQEVVDTAANSFREIFGHCVNGPTAAATTEECIDFLKSHSDYRAYFYIGTWGRSVERIKHEEKVRLLAEDYLDHKADRSDSALTIRNKMVDDFQQQELLKTFESIDLPQFTRPRILLLSLAALMLLPLWLPLLLLTALALWVFERVEQPFDLQNLDLKQIQGVANQEDHIVQNQLTHLVEIKYSIFRGVLLKVVLSGIQLLAVYKFNKGKLGNIPTIHFARWVRIDGGKRLLFFSNYDGSWESYLGDFIDKASVGLTGVWSNTRWFPRALMLLFRGAKDEQRFKAWTRTHQIYTDVWYSAYKTLSVRNILNNTDIYDGLLKPNMTEVEAENWLSHF